MFIQNIPCQLYTYHMTRSPKSDGTNIEQVFFPHLRLNDDDFTDSCCFFPSFFAAYFDIIV